MEGKSLKGAVGLRDGSVFRPCGIGVPNLGLGGISEITTIDADRLVPVATTRAGVDKMKSIGMDYQYVEVPGGDHMTPLGRMPENMKKVFDFFDAHPKK